MESPKGGRRSTDVKATTNPAGPQSAQSLHPWRGPYSFLQNDPKALLGLWARSSMTILSLSPSSLGPVSSVAIRDGRSQQSESEKP